MILKFFFSRLSLKKQVTYLKKKGVMLGTRVKEGRKIYLFMLPNLFIEVFFKNDNIDDEAERLSMVHGLDNLNDYLEKEFRTNF